MVHAVCSQSFHPHHLFARANMHELPGTIPPEVARSHPRRAPANKSVSLRHSPPAKAAVTRSSTALSSPNPASDLANPPTVREKAVMPEDGSRRPTTTSVRLAIPRTTASLRSSSATRLRPTPHPKALRHAMFPSNRQLPTGLALLCSQSTVTTWTTFVVSSTT
jgi:hypothetical protein